MMGGAQEVSVPDNGCTSVVSTTYYISADDVVHETIYTCGA